MWAGLYPGGSEQQVPIGHITNGVHVPSWLADQMRQVVRPPPRSGLAAARSATPGFWEAIDGVNDGELWETHQTLKTQLIDTARRRAVQCATARGESPSFIALLRRALSPDALTIGFARRFATYKRANLLLKDIDAIAALVNHPQRPVQFMFAGKAHPHDNAGQGHAAAGRAADAGLTLRGQAAVPRGLRHQRRPAPGPGRGSSGSTTRAVRSRPCGTSGQKVVLNGGLNLVDPRRLVGGGLRRPERLRDRRRRDAHVDTTSTIAATATRCFRSLQDEVVPLYYDRDSDGLPRRWIAPRQARRSAPWAGASAPTAWSWTTC